MLKFQNCKIINDLDSLENYDEICVYEGEPILKLKKDVNLLLNNENVSEIVLLISNRNQSFKVEGKNEYMKESVRKL